VTYLAFEDMEGVVELDTSPWLQGASFDMSKALAWFGQHNASPDYIVTNQATAQAYQNFLTGNAQYTNQVQDLGQLTFRGIPLVFDAQAPQNRLVILGQGPITYDFETPE
jgi:hypothetical protein